MLTHLIAEKTEKEEIKISAWVYSFFSLLSCQTNVTVKTKKRANEGQEVVDPIFLSWWRQLCLFQMNSVKDNISTPKGKKSKITPWPKMEQLKLLNLDCNFPCLATFVDKQMWDLDSIELNMNLAPYGRTFVKMLWTSRHFGWSEILEFPDSHLAEGGAWGDSGCCWKGGWMTYNKRFHNRSYFCSSCRWLLGDERNKTTTT